jgi:N6-adenosine-specific RNA methylase IME4
VKYRTIVADPPWPYDSADGGRLHSSQSHRPNSGGRLSKGVGHLLRYPSMSMDAIKALAIPAERDAHLYLWTTNAFMVEAHDVCRAWGFTPKTILTWGKVKHDDHAKASMKTGYWFRGATEHVIFGVRGALRITGEWPTLLLWPREARHSAKPEAFYDMVEQASPGPYLEMFSRRHRLLWDVWGDQSANTATLEAIS